MCIAVTLRMLGVMPKIRIPCFFISSVKLQFSSFQCFLESFQFKPLASLDSHVKIPIRLYIISEDPLVNTLLLR